MARNKDQSAEVRRWLESPEGQKWSRDHHGDLPARDGGMGTTGVFAEFKTDYEGCVFTGRCPDHGGKASR